MPPSSGTADVNPQVQHAKAFSVSIPTLTLEVGLFTQVTGISAQVDVMEYPEGGINTFVHRLPTRDQTGEYHAQARRHQREGAAAVVPVDGGEGPAC